MITLYRPDSTTCTVTPVTAKNPRYPGVDDEGVAIYDNSHFGTEREAWAWLVRDAEAGLSLGAREITRIDDMRARVLESIACDACRLTKARDGLAALKETT